MKHHIALIGLVGCVTLSGCQTTQLKERNVIKYNAKKRGTYVIKLEQKTEVCPIPNDKGEGKKPQEETSSATDDTADKNTISAMSSTNAPIKIPCTTPGKECREDRWIILAEPQPDMASSMAIDALAKLKIKGEDATVKATVTQSLAEVGKVTSANKFLRDALYRFAEMKASGTLNDEKDHATFKEILKSSIAYAEAARQEAEATRQEEENKQKLVARYLELSKEPNAVSPERSAEIQELLKAIQY